MTMRTHVSFRGEFPKVRTARVPGEELAAVLREGLRGHGFVCEPPRSLDYAHELVCRHGRQHIRIVVGLAEDDEREWLVFVEPQRDVLQTLLRRGRDTPAQASACRGLHELLVGDQRIRSIQWFTEREWNDPTFGQGHDQPT